MKNLMTDKEFLKSLKGEMKSSKYDIKGGLVGDLMEYYVLKPLN